MFEFQQSKIIGCYEVQPLIYDDKRGRFVKVYHYDSFINRSLETNFVEEYYSISHKNVIRGLHFQLPPFDHVKLVYCVVGEVLDVVVDLRMGSPTYGQHALFELNARKANSIYIPKGMAHGFCVLSEQAIMVYKVSTIYSPLHDTGLLWNSAGIPWPIMQPCISERDNNFPSLAELETQFKL